MNTHQIEHQRDILSKALINEVGSARYIPDVEEHRVSELLNEQYVDPYAGESRLVGLGRALLEKAGLHKPKSPQLVERPYLEENQQIKKDHLEKELDRSRELIRNNIVEGVDDVAVDARLGLRTEESLLPPLFRRLHSLAEEEAGHKITFLKWMTDYATNEQLTNVWQWHDKYLNDLDNDPAFQERVGTVKASYTEGSQQAIAAGALHPDIAVQEPKMQHLRFVHGSPFSPVLASGDAYADRRTGVVQMREGVSDFTLYHEMTHLLSGGMQFEFDEATTDLIAVEIYNRSHPTQEHIDPRKSVYGDQIATLDALNRMSGGKAGLYELSGSYAGPDGFRNMLLFTVRIDKAIGIPVTIPMINSSRALVEKIATAYAVHTVSRAAQQRMREQAEFLAAMMFDENGNKVASTIKELATRMTSPDTRQKYGQDVVLNGLSILLESHNIQENLQDS